MAKKFSPKKFEDLVASFYEDINRIATTKGVEYSGDADRLKNFRETAAALGISKEAVLLTFMKKHQDSIATYIKSVQAGRKPKTSEPIRGRILDNIVYLLLFAAMVEEGHDDE